MPDVMHGLQVGSNVLLTTVCPLGPNGETRTCSAEELKTTSPLKPVWPIAMANMMVVFHVLGSYQVCPQHDALHCQTAAFMMQMQKYSWLQIAMPEGPPTKLQSLQQHSRSRPP